MRSYSPMTRRLHLLLLALLLFQSFAVPASTKAGPLFSPLRAPRAGAVAGQPAFPQCVPDASSAQSTSAMVVGYQLHLPIVLSGPQGGPVVPPTVSPTTAPTLPPTLPPTVSPTLAPTSPSELTPAPTATPIVSGTLPGTTVEVWPGQPAALRHNGASLIIPAGAVESPAVLSADSLATVATLDPGMTNVTRGPQQGFRFLPHRQFKKQLILRLPYDPALLPPGSTPDDIHSYYFDTNSGHWQPLGRISVETVTHEIVSCTDHFTDLINGVVTVPDAPDSVSFNPTQIKDIKAADPSAQIGLIEPPQAGPMGDAGLGLPIELPPGRAGVQPQREIGYSSGGGNSWLGQGWDLSVPSIGIDTRWGVPRYDPLRETETYVLNGQQLTPLAHRDIPQARQAERTFHTRVEGSFQRITRHGSGPQTYWWEVTDKNGTTYAYGGDLATGQVAPDTVLADARGNIFQWALRTVRDTHGNTVEYRSTLVSDLSPAGGSEVGYTLYPQTIRYTGFQGQAGPYQVRFVRASELGEARRLDPIISGRGGFKQVTADLLRQIEITYAGALVRRYDLHYVRGMFGKTLLEAVAQYGAEGGLLATHTFGYYNDVAGGLFGSQQDWDTGGDGVSGGLLGFGKASALGADQTNSIGGHLYIGINLLFLPIKQFSVGAKVGFSGSSSRGLLSNLDINGDGLPDKVYKHGGMIAYRPNRSGPNGVTVFGESRPVGNLSEISRGKSQMFSGGAELYMGASVGFNIAKTTSKTSVFFLDVNSDGLPDIVQDGQVLFNHLAPNGDPVFTPNSLDTPYPIGPGAVDATHLIERQDALRQEFEAAFPLLDTVRRWVAPFTGRVQVSGPVALQAPAAPADDAAPDGVRVAVQLNDRELWAARIPAGDYAARTPSGLDALNVRAGDVVYFRVQSVSDGANDQVAWDPQVQYLTVPAGTTDANGLDVSHYGAAADFALSGFPGAVATAPTTGTLRLSGTLRKNAATSDDVTLRLTKNGAPLRELILRWDQTGALVLDEDVAVNAGDQLGLAVWIDSPIDLRTLIWDAAAPPRLTYTSRADSGPVVDDQGNPAIQVDLLPSVDLYPQSSLSRPLDAWVAPATGSYTLQPDLSTASGTNGTVVLTVKRQGALVAKQAITVSNGSVSPASLSFSATAGERLFIEYSTRQSDLAARLSRVDARISGPGVSNASVPSALYSPSAAQLVAPAYRGWSVFGYDGSGARASSPIALSADDLNGINLRAALEAMEQKAHSATLDTLDGQSAAQLPQMPVTPFYPSIARQRWQSGDENAWAEAARVSSSRNGLDSLDLPDPSGFAGARGVVRYSTSKQQSLMLGASFLSGSIGKSKSAGKLDMLDLNGDSFPDIVGACGVQYTDMLGGLESGCTPSLGGDVRNGSDKSFNFGVGGNYPLTRHTGGGGSRATNNQMASLGLSGNLTKADSEADYDLMDVNGDGLPDRVWSDGELKVGLNIGYGFLPPEPWGGAAINNGASKGFTLGASVGFNDGIYGFSGGVNLSRSTSDTKRQLIDLNGDGLADDLDGSSVSFNPGGSFGGGSAGLPGTPGGADISLGGGVYFTLGIPLGIGPGLGVQIIINPGGDVSQAVNRSETVYEDINGDGDPDFLESTSDGSVTVHLNQTARTNLLQVVHRPLGGTIRLDYARTGNTYAQPHNRWVLSRVELNDGHPGDGEDTQLTTYRYQDGFYDRREREFYGFRTVIGEQRDAGAGEALYRTVTQTFDNTSYYGKGLLLREVMTDAAGNPYRESVNSYLLRDVATGLPVSNPASLTATVFPELRRTDTRFYEGQPTAGKSTYVTYEYDALGNPTRYLDAGDASPQDDVVATIGYFSDPARYIVGKPDSTVVTGGGVVMRRREATFQPGTGDLLQVRQYLADGQAAVSDLTYDRYGNILSLTGPSNYRGQRYRLDFQYDAAVATYNTRVVDSFGYVSTSAYNLLFGQLERSVDINGQPVSYSFDQFGRVIQVVGPYQADTRDYTIQFEYHPDAATPWALTRHIDVYRDVNDPIETVLFIDGLKRVVQTKKDATIHQGATGNAKDQMVVSGHVVFDFVGRTIAQSYPVVENLGRQGVFNADIDAIPPTTTTYDVLDRALSVTIPDGSVTSTSYGFGQDRDGATQFLTRVVDANGIPSESYRDVRELITAVKQFNNGGAQVIWTSYAYDPLKQILRVTDDKGNQTTAAYDLLGRRVALSSPDSGLTETTYDLASNVVRSVTGNLRAEGKAISYTYDYNRLSAILYPDFPGNNVTYTYGGPGAPYGRAGRIVTVRDESGSEERFYGPLGEMVKAIKTVASETQGNSDNSPEVYVSEYTYDTWNRLQSMVYPDGELLTNRYDSGGLLRQIEGAKGKNAYAYLDRLEYDKFDQRVFVQYPNGNRTTYDYDPLNRRLASLRAGKASGNGQLFQDLTYAYDKVGNILGQANHAAIKSPSQMGGATNYVYRYDDLYRLVSSEGTFDTQPDKQYRYTLDMAYDTIHNIVSKDQQTTLREPSGTLVPQQKISYDWQYGYSGPQPHAPTHIGERTFTYDANGNQTGWTSDVNGTRRAILWDEENRIQSISDNGHTFTYKYNDAGERVIKRGPQGETVYVSQFFVIRNREVASKHVFAGTERIVTKLMKQDKPGANPKGNQPLEKDLYFYHPDHLGSSAYVTDAKGDLYQHLEYFPFGETFVEEDSNTQRTPYLFTAKELDEETQLYYYGARYYDPRTSLWQSPDQILDEYLPTGDGEQDTNLPGMGGVFNSLNLGLYTYSHHNPLKYTDPDGDAPGYFLPELSSKYTYKIPDEAQRVHLEEGMKSYLKASKLSDGWYKVNNDAFHGGNFANVTSSLENGLNSGTAWAHSNVVRVQGGRVIHVEGYYNDPQKVTIGVFNWSVSFDNTAFTPSSRYSGIYPGIDEDIVFAEKIEGVGDKSMLKAIQEVRNSSFGASSANNWRPSLFGGSKGYGILGNQCQNFVNTVRSRAQAIEAGQKVGTGGSIPSRPMPGGGAGHVTFLAP